MLGSLDPSQLIPLISRESFEALVTRFTGNTMNLSKLFICSAVFSVVCATPLAAEVVANDNSNVAGTNTAIGNAATTEAPTLTPAKINYQPLLERISKQAILPLYKAVDQETSALQRQVISFCNQPNLANLQATRQHWSQALSAWEASEVALFGPALSKQRDLHIYFRPIKKRVIKKLLNQDMPISMDNLEFAGVGAQGFATLEYLMFNRDKTDEEILKQFTGNNNRYCQHLLATSTLLQRDISKIYHEWQNTYADAIANAGDGENPIFANNEQALEMTLGKLDQLAEAVINKLRNPLAKNAQLAGKDDQRENTNAYKLEAWRSGHTLKNIQANIQGIEQVLKQGGILYWLKQHGEAGLAKQLEDQLVAISDIKFPSTDLFAQIENKDLKASDTLFDEVLTLSKLIHSTAPKLGVQLGFNDSDGD